MPCNNAIHGCDYTSPIRSAVLRHKTGCKFTPHLVLSIQCRHAVHGCPYTSFRPHVLLKYELECCYDPHALDEPIIGCKHAIHGCIFATRDQGDYHHHLRSCNFDPRQHPPTQVPEILTVPHDNAADVGIHTNPYSPVIANQRKAVVGQGHICRNANRGCQYIHKELRRHEGHCNKKVETGSLLYQLPGPRPYACSHTDCTSNFYSGRASSAS